MSLIKKEMGRKEKTEKAKEICRMVDDDEEEDISKIKGYVMLK